MWGEIVLAYSFFSCFAFGESCSAPFQHLIKWTGEGGNRGHTQKEEEEEEEEMKRRRRSLVSLL